MAGPLDVFFTEPVQVCTEVVGSTGTTWGPPHTLMVFFLPAEALQEAAYQGIENPVGVLYAPVDAPIRVGDRVDGRAWTGRVERVSPYRSPAGLGLPECLEVILT